MLVHTVYFWLKPELTPAQRADFRRGVESLGTIKAVDKAYVGTPAATEKRPIIDDSYSVALTVLCRDLAAHDAYQVDPIHLAFIAQCKACWTRVQIYDAVGG
ncbi:MAG: Dabb family protein [Opitutus sp.]|nr:Dabb family protein [Opitutus sp.]